MSSPFAIEPGQSRPRPTSVTVLGVLNILFGALGLIGTAFSLALIFMPEQFEGADNPFLNFAEQPLYSLFLKVGGVLAVPMTALLAFSGIGLLQMRSGGRVAAIIYAWYAIVSTIVGIAMQAAFVVWPLAQQAGQDAQSDAILAGSVGGLFGGCIGLVFPVLLIYFLNRPHVLAAFAGKWTPPGFEVYARGEAEAQAAILAEIADPSANPYAATNVAGRNAAPTAYVDGVEGVVDKLIPSRNGAALAAYYLGLFSLFPCLGFFLGVAAVVLGIQGLRNERRDSAVRGGAHAWIGIICGGLFGLFNLLLLVFAAVGYFLAGSGP